MTGMKKDERSREFTSLPNINTWLNVQQFWNKSQLWKRKISSWWCLHINVEVRAAYSFFKKCCFFDRKYSTYYWFWITYSCKQKHMLLLRKSTLNGVSNKDMFCFRVSEHFYAVLDHIYAALEHVYSVLEKKLLLTGTFYSENQVFTGVSNWDMLLIEMCFCSRL